MIRNIFKIIILIFFFSTFANAQSLDPVCDNDIEKNKFGDNNLLAGEKSNEKIDLLLRTFQEDKKNDLKKLIDNSGIKTTNYFVELKQPGIIQQVVIPELTDKVVVEKKMVKIGYNSNDLANCESATKEFLPLNKKTDLNDNVYLCALLKVNRYCLTNSEVQPHVQDPSIPKRAVVIFTFKNEPFCTGLLLDEKTVRTARHCFITPSNGRIQDVFNVDTTLLIALESIDGKRKGTVTFADIEKIATHNEFYLDDDSISLSVKISKDPDAKILPEVLFVQAINRNELLWLAGPVPLLHNALIMRATAINPENLIKKANWRDGVRFSAVIGGQCRIKAIEENCIYHTCQTFAGFSGSPMITRAYMSNSQDTPVIEYVGVHSGSPSLGNWPVCNVTRDGFISRDYTSFNLGDGKK